MLNPITSEATKEAFYSATYVDNYIDSVENLPDDVQRFLSRIRDIDVQYRGHLQDVDHYYELWKSLQATADSSATRKARAIARMQQSLIQAQELGDEKMQVVNQLQELIDFKTRQLDTDQKNLDIKDDVQQQHRVDIMQQMDDYSGPPLKQSRLQSPTRGDLIGSTYGIGGNGNGERQKGIISYISRGDYNSNLCTGLAGSGSSSAGGRSTPNSERSGNIGTVINSGPGGVSGSVNNSNLIQMEMQQRNASKRSRRRNDTVNMITSMEMGSNESNSATEIGNNIGNERNSTQKTGVSAGQKKNSQNSAGLGGANSGNMGTGGSSSANSGKKKKRKSRGQSNSNQVSLREETPPPDPIDPDEPTYCLCNQISFGEMILCDNDLCPIEWFHFSCVSLVLKPKGKWFCPKCRGDKPNVMKPKAQFLKELERYNKEKEEKT